VLLDQFQDEYNHRRPHRSLPHRATPATAFNARPKPTPGTERNNDTHDRVRHDKISKAGTITLRIAGQLRHIGVGRTYAGTYVILLVQNLEVRVVNAATGEPPLAHHRLVAAEAGLAVQQENQKNRDHGG
jgi:hypothetical protein